MEIGKNVDAWCSRCKLQLAHTIETMVDGKPKRVHCNTCRTQHMYRSGPPGAGKAGKAGTRSGSGRASAAGRSGASSKPTDYESLLRGRTASDARTYSTTQRWKVGELVKHATFGLGAVTGERGNKIDVLFADGPRVLIQAG